LIATNAGAAWAALAALTAAALLGTACGAGQGLADDDAHATGTTPPVAWFSEEAAGTGLDAVHFNGMSGAFYFPEMMGPGIALFDALREGLGDLPLVAEDLGFITQDVYDLRHAIGLPGMKILQFGFGESDAHLPHRMEPQTVVYTGTHDNDTARGWFDNAPDDEREAALAYLGCNSAEDIAAALIRAAYTSVAETAIVPIQDILGLGSGGRMNRPGAENGNWTWRLPAGALTREDAARLRKLATLTGRA